MRLGVDEYRSVQVCWSLHHPPPSSRITHLPEPQPFWQAVVAERLRMEDSSPRHAHSHLQSLKWWSVSSLSLGLCD